MRKKVIKFLQNLPIAKYDQFNEAFELYRNSEGKSFGVERSINASGFSESALENLLYDLQKLHGITDVEKVNSVQLAVVSDQEEECEDGAFQTKYFTSKSAFEMTEEELIAWGIERELSNGDLTEILALAINSNYDKISEGLIKALEKIESDKLNVAAVEGKILSTEPIDTNTEAVQATTEPPINEVNALVEENKNLTAENEDLLDEKADLEEELEASTEEVETLKEENKALKSLPKIDVKSIRVEFPFLNEKDCPDEFKILIADKITAWNKYLDAHEQIFKIHSGEIVGTEEETAALAEKAVKAFDENQKIYDELNAYQTTGKVLGLHPIFKKLQLTREVEEMTADELVKYKSSSAKYFTDNRQSLAKAEKAKNTDKIELITNRVAEREQKLALVNKKLGINPK